MSVRKRFRELIAAPGMALAPGAYDALSARIMEVQGFDVICAGGYAATGTLLAEPDMGQASMRDYADHYARICAAVSIPVYVDADTGFGGVHNVRQMVRAFESAGVAGLCISDQVFPNRCGYMAGKQIVPPQEMLAKLQAALDARRDADLVIVGRTDALAIEGLDRAIERAQLYREIGSDIAKVIGADRIEPFKRIVAEVPGPQFANMSNANPAAMPGPADFEAAGAALMMFPSAALFAAVRAVTRTMSSLKQTRDLQASRPGFCTLAEYNDLVGLGHLTASEETYGAAAKKVLENKPAPHGPRSARPPGRTLITP